MWREAGNESGRVSSVARSALSLTTLAMVILCAGCGGGSGKTSAKTLPVGGTTGEVSAREGEFRTIVPPVYVSEGEAPVQYWARGPEEAGFVTSILVARERAPKGGLNAYARLIYRNPRHTVSRLSRPPALRVDGVPALAVDYFESGTGTQAGKVQHVRQVMVQHGPWIFLIRDFALPNQYAASLEALDEVISHWRWQ
jgi:hypothetical protein